MHYLLLLLLLLWSLLLVVLLLIIIIIIIIITIIITIIMICCCYSYRLLYGCFICLKCFSIILSCVYIYIHTVYIYIIQITNMLLETSRFSIVSFRAGSGSWVQDLCRQSVVSNEHPEVPDLASCTKKANWEICCFAFWCSAASWRQSSCGMFASPVMKQVLRCNLLLCSRCNHHFPSSKMQLISQYPSSFFWRRWVLSSCLVKRQLRLETLICVWLPLYPQPSERGFCTGS